VEDDDAQGDPLKLPRRLMRKISRARTEVVAAALLHARGISVDLVALAHRRQELEGLEAGSDPPLSEL
jgi:hypothetical protein